jgi:hypothetical protein
MHDNRNSSFRERSEWQEQRWERIKHDGKSSDSKHDGGGNNGGHVHAFAGSNGAVGGTSAHQQLVVVESQFSP